MAQGYMMDEALGFVTAYMKDFRTIVGTRIWDSNEEESVTGVVLEGKPQKVTLNNGEINSLHSFIPNNVEGFQPSLE